MLPDPDALHPLPHAPEVVFLRGLAAHAGIDYLQAGEYSYFATYPAHDPTLFVTENILYRMWSPAKLRIGRFCAIGAGCRFLMGGSNHPNVGVATYPFAVLPGWQFPGSVEVLQSGFVTDDTVLGHDVWLGLEAIVMPGITIGHGAIVAAGAVVTEDVAPYAIVGGNPARVIRHRYDPDQIALLLEVAWWDWPLETIRKRITAIASGSPHDLVRELELG